ncbi:MAG: hypothetical protein LBK73_07560 [Treponema sp.]|jgi:hypothetical protein|nr:hypothetical protein [Treponema sp.]
MEVSAWKSHKHGGTYGIRVGVENRRRFFNPLWKEIEVEIDGTPHTFQLTSTFWSTCPEFRDSGATAIQDWLRCNYEILWPYRRPPRFALEVVGEQRFCLKPEPAHDK